jgi:hypothetical protein
MRKYLLILLFVCQPILADAPAHPIIETHLFKVRVESNYECYSKDGKQFLDSRNKEICNNRQYKKTLINKIIKIDIFEEPSPNGPIYHGDFLKEEIFKGRKFTLSLEVFMDIVNKKRNYSLRIVAFDDERTSRETAMAIHANQIKNLNPIFIDYYSKNGEPEISYYIFIQPANM